MKRVLSLLGQIALFALFLALFFAGSFFDLFGAHWFLSHPQPGTVRYFVPTGLLLMTLAYAVVFALEALARKLRTAGLATTIAFVLALVLGFAAKFGFVTR